MHIVGELVVLNHLRFMETGSPLFWVRALHVGSHLSPDDARLAWAHQCLADAISRLDALSHQPPDKEKQHWDSIIEALGFLMRPNHNPFREINHILQRDEIFAAVLQHGEPLTGEDGAFSAVARARGLSVSTARAAYYSVKRRLKQLSTN
jgi:hypothetical protein